MNPELARNLWLEASPRRIAWAVLALVLVYFAVGLLSRDSPVGPLPMLAGAGSLVFVLSAILWGGRAAAGAVLGEIADRTWDFQRLSTLSPWAMTWGKLLGATALPWLCGLTGLALAATYRLQLGDAAGLWSLVFLAALAVALQAASLAAALIGVRKARAEGRTARAGGVLGGILLAVVLLLGVAGSAGFQKGFGLQGLGRTFLSNEDIVWWGATFAAPPFRATVTLLLAFWSLAAAWRLMRLELQMKNAPVVWPAFLVFLAVFLGGFAFQEGLSAALIAGALAVALVTYAAAFADPADPVRTRLFLTAVGHGDFGRAAPLTPPTVAPVALATLLAMGALATGWSLDGANALQGIALIAFVLRDLGVITLLRFGGRPQRGDFGAIVALAVLYGVGGVLGSAIAQGLGRALFAPLNDAPLVSLVSGLIQAVIAWALAAGRMRAPKVKLQA